MPIRSLDLDAQIAKNAFGMIVMLLVRILTTFIMILTAFVMRSLAPMARLIMIATMLHRCRFTF
ncbi:hypothetical protein SH501x_004215 [Pirellulaceae bacterium SH501]